MKTKIYSALNDFTEADKAKQQWVLLQENRFRQECEPKRDKSVNWTKWLVLIAFGVFLINWIFR